tara:strand:+ start:221 stop:406 length:186 start_codon:yes stop_codon:yes gene_type:complete
MFNLVPVIRQNWSDQVPGNVVSPEFEKSFCGGIGEPDELKKIGYLPIAYGSISLPNLEVIV